MPAGLLAVSTDSRGFVTWCNAAVESLVGRSSAELQGRPFPMETFDPEPGADAATDGAEGGGTVATSGSWDVRAADGSRRIVSVNVQPLVADSGQVHGYFAQGLDVTEERRASELLAQALLREQRAARRLAELERMRDDFVTTAGHELRTPLTSILGYLELLEHGIDDQDQRTRFADAIRRNVARLQHLAESLVTLSDTTADRTPATVPVDLRHVVEVVRAGLPGDRGADAVLLEVVCPVRPVLVLGDAPRLELLLRQLVDNAVTFTPAGGRVVCRVSESAGTATIEVSDTGPGVPHAELPHLFTPFFRGSASQELTVAGPGLGLGIAATVAEEHAGRILVSDNVPHGSVFTLQLPSAP